MSRFGLVALATFSALCAPLWAQAAEQRPDLADRVVGTYHGAITQALHGGSRGGVSCGVTRIARNTVAVSCDDPRVPTVRIRLTRPSSTIQNAGGRNTFLVELNRDPGRLDLSIGGVTLMVHR